jgi:POT family proton-dependent oligopeptide transporter
MVISLLTFINTQKSMGEIGLSPLSQLTDKKRKITEWATYIGSLVLLPVIMIMVSKTEYTDYFMYTIGPLTLFIWDMK